MADPINHDGLSTTATVAGSAAKWGLLGAVAAFALPLLVLGGGGLLLGGAVAAAATGGAAGAVASIGGFLIGAVGVIGGLFAGVASASAVGGTAAAAGGLIGAVKGANQVGRENAAYRNRGLNHQFKEARAGNDRELKGFNEGYSARGADMEPQIQAREIAAFDRGEKNVLRQLQEHVEAQQPGAGKGRGTGTVEPGSSKGSGGFSGKELSLSCESKAKIELAKRDASNSAEKTI